MEIPKKCLVVSLIVSIVLIVMTLVNISRIAMISSKYCTKDSDCVLVQDGCCGCSMGGSNTAINKLYEEAWNIELSSKCANVLCPAVISKNPSCFSEPRCVEWVCTPVPE